MPPESLYEVLEYLGVVTGLMYLVLAIYQRRECWIFYTISAFAYMPVMAHQGLYLYAGMQIFFATSGVYGWWSWGRKGGEQELLVHRTTVRVHVKVIAAGLLLSAALASVLTQFGSFWNALGDALMSVFSLVATLCTAKKLLEGWRYWIAVNVLAVALYSYKEMWPTVLLYAVYLVSSIYGVRKWSGSAEHRQA